MTVTVGTDVFASVAKADAFFAARGFADWAALATPAKEPLLVNGSDVLARMARWRGSKATSSQRLPWPRIEAEDDEGNEITGIPWQVEEALFLIVKQLMAGVDLDGVVTAAAPVKLEKVDVITVEYDTAERLLGPAVLTHVIQLLSSVTLGDQLLRS